MEKNEIDISSLDSLSGITQDPMVTTNEGDFRLYDADTIIKDESEDSDKEAIRIKGLDAPERPELNEDNILIQNLFSDNYRDVTKDYMENKGFSNINYTGEQDVYGRNLATLEDNLGRSLAYQLTREGIQSPSRYELDSEELHEAWTASRFDALMGQQNALPEFKQLENIIQQHSTPRFGSLNWQEQQALPASLRPVNKAIDASFSGQAEDAFELWWYQNIGAWNGIKALVGFKEEGFKGMDETQQEVYRNIQPTTIVSIEQIEDGADALAWFQNNLIMHLPDYALLAGGGKAGATIGSFFGPVGTVTGGVLGSIFGMGYNFLKSTGNVAQEQYEVTGDVDPVQAVLMGSAIFAIDRIGATNVLKPQDLLTKEGYAKAVKELATSKEISEEAAKELLDKSVHSNLKDLATEVSVKSADLLAKRQIALGTAFDILKKGGKEGLTEASQEALQYLGINGMPQTSEQWDRFGMRLADAAAAGGAVGTVYNASGSLVERNQIESFRDSLLEYDQEKATLNERLSVEGNTAMNNMDLEEVIASKEYGLHSPLAEDEESWENMVSKGKQKGYGLRALKKLTEGRYIPGLSAIKNTIRSYLINKNNNTVSIWGTLIANIEGAYQSMGGNSLFNEEQSRLADVMRANPWLSDPQTHLQVSVDELNTILNSIANDTTSQLDPKYDSVQKEVIKSLMDMNLGLQELFKKAPSVYSPIMQQLLNQNNYKYLLSAALPDTKKVFANSQKFRDIISQHIVKTSYKDKKAGQPLGEEHANRILNGLFNGDVRNIVKEINDLGLYEDLKSFYPDNPIKALQNKVLSDVKYATRAQYRGSNNIVFANLIHRMLKNGEITQEQAYELAADLQDQIDKHSLKFGRIKNEQLANAQDIARSITSFGLMDMVLFSQMGEAMMTFIGTNQSIAKNIHGFAKSFVETFIYSLPSINKKRKETESISQYKDLGYDEDELIRQQGAEMNNKLGKTIQKYFYKINLLSQTTDAIRISRLNLAMDTISQLANELAHIDNFSDLTKLTRREVKIYERLAYYGANVPRLIEIIRMSGTLDDNGLNTLASLGSEGAKAEEDLGKMYASMATKFVDEFSVRVKPGSRPTIFEDQRYGLPFLTQYLSFTANYHANQLPRLYTAYVRGVAEPMAYKTFHIMASAILVAYMSQFLKDLLVHGELNPYLKEDFGALQRAIQYSGLTGWGQDAFDSYFGNAYGMTNENIIDGIFNTPVASQAERVVSKILEGEFTEAAQKALPFGELTTEKALPNRIIQSFIGD